MQTNYLICKKIAQDFFYSNTLKMYNCFCQESFPKAVNVVSGFEDLVECIYKKHGQETVINVYSMDKMANTADNNKVLCGFSGWLDSAYIALNLAKKGYDVILFHVKGLNGAYPKEDDCAKRFAKESGMKYIECEAKHEKKEFFVDNPLKNQVILSLMLDYGRENNISKFSMGEDWTTNIEDGIIGYTVTDTKEVNELYWKGVTKYWENATLILIEDDVKKVHRLKYIAENYPTLLNVIYSCITPHRFNSYLHRQNEEKYGIKLLDDRCGSCYKCCMEYLLLTDIGYYPINQEYIDHCWKVLSDGKNSHRKDLFDKKIPLIERYNNLLNYGS